MNGQRYLSEITKYLAQFTSQVRIENKNGNFDINKYAEGFLIPILNEIYKKTFKRLEFIKQNYPAIDLGSTDNQISIQVTSEIGFDKIKNTLSKFIENKLFDTYSELYHLVINEDYKTSKTNEDISTYIKIELSKLGLSILPKVEFLIEKNLINISTLRALIEKECDIDQLKEIRDYLEKQYGKVIVLPYFEDILIPYQVAFRTQLDKENKNLPNQFHTPFFGREADLEKLDKFINDNEKDVFAIVSDGGYGKTRLAIEIFNKYATEDGEFEAFLLNESAFQCLDFAEQLKTEKKVLILFDDAHNRPEILNDVIGVAQRLENVKVILTLRKAVYSDTIKTVSSHRRLFEPLELNRLSYDETQALFKSQLGGLKDFEIKRLSEESGGVPIVILGLCQVTLQGMYKSELSEEANFVQFVKEIKEQVISNIHKRYYIEEEKINKTIQLISFFSPIKNTPEEISELARLNLIDVEETNLIIDYLYEYEFINKHHEISIKPDPYSDTILLDSAQRLKYLLQKDLGGFIDRLIRNLVEVEQSQRLDLSIDHLLYEFISTFKDKKTDTSEEIYSLVANLETLKSFTYKKPRIWFFAVKDLINSKCSSDDFWKTEEPHIFYDKSFKEVHENLETILSIIALNTHNESEFDELYELLWEYKSKKTDSNIFQKAFRYRVYDFVEYGYRPITPCERQVYLVKKLDSILQEKPKEAILLNHVFDCIKSLLVIEFEGESFYDKYTHALSWGRHCVLSNETTEQIRTDSLSLLFKIYFLARHEKYSEDYLEQILRILFFMAKEKHEKYEFNQSKEVDLVVDFLRNILNDRPSINERSKIIRQLKIFERREIKDIYKDITDELLKKSETVSTPKERLALLFLDEYFSLRNNIENIFNEIIEQYPDNNSLFIDIIEVKIELAQNDFSNFNELLSFLIKKYPKKSKELLELVITKYPEQACDFSTLIKANYEDDKYFYSIIDKIWNLKFECAKGSVLWMLTNGRNRETELYKEDDLKYFEYIVDNKLINQLWSTSSTLPKYILINPTRTLSLVSKIFKLSENEREEGFLLHSIFEDKEILDNHSALLKDFVFSSTLEIPIDFHYLDEVLYFLEDYFGFDLLFTYLKEKISLIEKEKKTIHLSYHKHYSNPHKEPNQSEEDFVKVIKWYAELENKSDYIHKVLVEFIRPAEIKSERFKSDFKVLIEEAGVNIEKVVDLCKSLDVYENKSEFLISLLIEIANELCEKYKIGKAQLIDIFGSDYIRNFGAKLSPASGPFPHDLNKKKELIDLMKKHKMHPKVKEIFKHALENVNDDIERDRNFDVKW